jgi:hypothetical protein
MGGARPFWYLVSECDPGARHTSLPPVLRKVIDDKGLDKGHVPLGSVLEIVKDRLAKYEAKTGYRFNFSQTSAYAGAAALHEATDIQFNDPTIGAIQAVAQTMNVD